MAAAVESGVYSAARGTIVASADRRRSPTRTAVTRPSARVPLARRIATAQGHPGQQATWLISSYRTDEIRGRGRMLPMRDNGVTQTERKEVVQQAIEDRRGDDGVAGDRAPVAKALCWTGGARADPVSVLQLPRGDRHHHAR